MSTSDEHEDTLTKHEKSTAIERIDKYNIRVDGVKVAANADQEQRIRAMPAWQRERFVQIFCPRLEC